jgi:hypothetical protein
MVTFERYKINMKTMAKSTDIILSPRPHALPMTKRDAW